MDYVSLENYSLINMCLRHSQVLDIWLISTQLLFFFFSSSMLVCASVLREDASIHRTNLKYCGKSPKILFIFYFRIL